MAPLICVIDYFSESRCKSHQEKDNKTSCSSKDPCSSEGPPSRPGIKLTLPVLPSSDHVDPDLLDNLDASSNPSTSTFDPDDLKGRDLSKGGDDDSDVQSDSPLTSPFPSSGFQDYPDSSQSETSRSPFKLSQSNVPYPAPYAYTTGTGLPFKAKRGRGRPRKDPGGTQHISSIAIRKPR